MQPLIDLYKNSEQLHHAYFVVSHKVETAVSELKHFLEHVVGIQTHGNPDVSHQQFKTLTIAEARLIAENQERKSFSNLEALPPSRKIFIIETDFITEEAQNALLKVFEEPTVGTHFFIISPQDILLPTLRSRMHVVLHDTNETNTSSILKLKLGERLAKVKEITDAISDEENTKQDAIALLNEIERELYEKLHHTSENTMGIIVIARELKICEEARIALYDRGAPVKMILENVMLSI